MKTMQFVVVAFLLLAGVKPLRASTITFTWTGIGSGDVGGTNFVGGTTFVDAAFTITAVADTTGVINCASGCFSVYSTSSTIAIAGLPLANVLTGTQVIDCTAAGCHQSFDDVEYARQIGAGLLEMSDPSFATYDLSTSFGPVFNASPLLVSEFNCSFGCITSDQGNIEFSSMSNVTFSASTAAPEPATLTLLGIGFLGFGLLKRLPWKAY